MRALASVLRFSSYSLVSAVAFLAACSSDPSSNGGSSSNSCVYKEPGTDFAPCKSDGDCFSGWCNASCHPGACCENPNTTAIKAGRGYSCTSDADCKSVASAYLKKQGASAACHYDSLNMVSNGCTFSCSNQ